MYMVVLKKEALSKSQPSSIPAMMQNLFQSSEQSIVRSLERALDDFAATFKPPNDEEPPLTVSTDKRQDEKETHVEQDHEQEEPFPMSEEDLIQSAAKAMREELVDAEPLDVSIQDVMADVPPEKLQKTTPSVVDAQVVLDDPHPDGSSLSPDKGSKQSLGDEPLEVKPVQHKTRKTEPRNTEQSSTTMEDWSVSEARKRVQQMRKQTEAEAKPAEVIAEPDTKAAPSVPLPDSLQDFSVVQSKNLVQRARNETRTASAKLDVHDAVGRVATNKDTSIPRKEENPTEAPRKMPKMSSSRREMKVDRSDSEAMAKALQGNRKLNVRVVSSPKQEEEDGEEDDVMRQLIEDQPMTTSELAKNVTDLGKQLDRDKQRGTGFVDEAMKQTKELIRSKPNIVDRTSEKGALTEDEEMRRMFEAGAKLATSRITELEPTPAQKEELEDIIQSDQTISTHARVIEQDLVELELSVTPSVDGNVGPAIDIFNGPPRYGSVDDDEDSLDGNPVARSKKQVRLPRQLDVAVQQAKYAAERLGNMTTRSVLNESGRYDTVFFEGSRQVPPDELEKLQKVEREASEIGLIRSPKQLLLEKTRLEVVLDELSNQPEERFREIASSYKDLLLSNNFPELVRERMKGLENLALRRLRPREDIETERMLLGQLVAYAQILVKETQILGSQLEAQQLEIIESICKVAMDPDFQNEEERAFALTDAVCEMLPLLDDAFVAYLKFAIAEEEERLSQSRMKDDIKQARWLYILKIVQQGVYAELGKGIQRHVDHIFYILRMKTPVQRRQLLAALIDDMPTLDVRPFVQVVENIAGALGDGARGKFDDIMELGEMANNIIQLYHDTKELLPPERIKEKSKIADEWAIRQRKRLQKQRQEGLELLNNSQMTKSRQEEIDNSHNLPELGTDY
eukprot:Nitzschia sp. Nitz4//scaffold119_size111653//99948//102674//NITZ4_004212-RA/size111653-processed-gene-0.201-mRNA-1//-1//CDS//3329533902//1890//frame0